MRLLLALAIALALLPALGTAQTIARQLQGYATGDLPAVCPDGRLAYDATTEQLKECTSNTWTATSGAATDLACTDCVALTTETTGSYAAGDAEAGNATGVACTDCVALTSETSGSYVASVATTSPLAGGAAGSEGAAISLTLGTVGVDKGGTGVTAFGAAAGALVTSGPSGTGNLSSVTAVATGQVLTSAGTATNPAWSASPTITTLVAGTSVSTPLIFTGSAGGGSCGGGLVCIDDGLDVNGTTQLDGVLDANSTSDFAADITLSGTADLSATGTGTSCTAGRVCVNDDAEVNGTLTVDTAIDTPKIYTGTAVGGACNAGSTCLDDNVDVNGTLQVDGVLDVNSTAEFASVATFADHPRGVVQFVRKTSDESVTSSTTLQADDALTFAVAASETWEFQFVVQYASTTAGDFRAGLRFPTTPTTINFQIVGLVVAAANTGGGIGGDWLTLGNLTADSVSGLPLGGDTVVAVAYLTGFIVNSTNTGSVTLWWAQGTSSGTAATVKAGSYVRAHRIN